MIRFSLPLRVVPLIGLLAVFARAQANPNLLPDPSIEETQAPNQFGVPYKLWSGWKFEGPVEFRVGRVARTGQSSAEMVGAQGGKIRLATPSITVDPGRYRFSCYIRGLDIGTHPWGLSEDFNFADDSYASLKKTGSFGWTRIEMTRDVPARKEIVAHLGLWAPGRLWVDDAEIVKVADDAPLTPALVVGQEEAPLAPPGPIDPAKAIRCSDCGYRNMPDWKRCYACGAPLSETGGTPSGPPSRLLTGFEEGGTKPFDGGSASTDHATEGGHSLKLEKAWTSWRGDQDWSGYDFLEVDVCNSGDAPQLFYVEIHDKETTDYWTRVNYSTTIPPGSSTVIVPTDLYVGEKSRPGRPLDKANVNDLAFAMDDQKPPIYLDNVRLERDLSDNVKVPGLQAYDFGPDGMKPFSGFTAVTPGTLYSAGRGYGLKNAQIWRAYDALQPDPLYETLLCIEKGGFAVDVPNGRYHVWLNDDSPSGFWGEFQIYRERKIKANGTTVVDDRMDLAAFKRRYFRFADSDDSPSENAFDKYQIPYFNEKEFEVEVTNGQLYVEFEGENWANSVSALILYPADQDEAGKRYLKNLRERRRFYFDNYFKRVLPDPHKDAKGVIPDFAPNAEEKKKGYALFARDMMRDIPANAIPRRGEVAAKLQTFASAGQAESLVFSLYPLRDRGAVTVQVSDLRSAASVIPASRIEIGVVSHRLSRVTSDGAVYTIAPRYVMPRSRAEIRKGTTTTFWLTLHVPNPAKAGIYAGRILLRFADGTRDSLPVSVRIFSAPLDETDAAAGPWGSSIALPWYQEDLGDYDRQMYRKCLAKLRECGCTTFSGIPSLRITGWKDGKPEIDFAEADRQMADAKAAGFKSTVVNYNGGIGGFDNYFIDEGAMKSAGFADYVEFLKAILGTVDAHAKAAGWLPVAYNLCDEPIGDDLTRAIANAKAWRAAAPPGILTTGATSVESTKPDDPHLQLAEALKIPNLNGHNEAVVKAIQAAGSDWSFYNGDASRWTYGAYLYKCVKEFGMKFRLSWHFNAAAGDPYYALDCREDDYAWVNANASGDLIPTVHLLRDIREGITDYRYMLTLDRLCKTNPKNPAAVAGRKLIAEKLAAFHLGQTSHDALWPSSEYQAYRLKMAEAIEKLSANRMIHFRNTRL